MDILVLGGTAWLGAQVASFGLAAGHSVTCLARGLSGTVPAGAEHVWADRSAGGAYDMVVRRDWDTVVEVSWQPGWVREAVETIGPRSAHWIYVSSGNVYAHHHAVGADETADLLEPTSAEIVTQEQYGPAKVACELATREHVGDRLVIARAGLIGGPGDVSGRSGYWVARAARNPSGPMLVPDTPAMPTQVVDVRDLAEWLLRTAEQRLSGTLNAVGPVVPFGDWIDLARRTAGHTGPVVKASASWLLDNGVGQYMGPESLPMWLVDRSHAGWSARSGEAAAAAGLQHRSREDMQRDLLRWEVAQGLQRVRKCGLSEARENALLASLAEQ